MIDKFLKESLSHKNQSLYYIGYKDFLLDTYVLRDWYGNEVSPPLSMYVLFRWCNQNGYIQYLKYPLIRVKK